MVFTDSISSYYSWMSFAPEDEVQEKKATVTETPTEGEEKSETVKQTPPEDQDEVTDPEIELRQSRDEVTVVTNTSASAVVQREEEEQRQPAEKEDIEVSAQPSETTTLTQQTQPKQSNEEQKAMENVGGTTTTGTVPAIPAPSKLECDYDLNPTVLYQAIEAKQWEYAVNFMKRDPSIAAAAPAADGSSAQSEEAATWVVRKETNGKLRWRLLPLHAAVIFGAPPVLVDLLLLEYPYSAQCKDDQGMLPLHLAFRNEAHWEVMEELLTAYPQALFVKDRKGRTPLQCGAAAVHRSVVPAGSVQSGSNTISASDSVVTGDPTSDEQSAVDIQHAKTLLKQQHRQSFRTIVGVMELYTKICVTEERQRTATESRTTLETRIGQLQDSHLNTLTSLKREWQAQREESKMKVQTLQDDNRTLKKKYLDAETEVSVTKAALKDAQEQLAETKAALAIANAKTSQVSNQRLEYYQQQNVTLRTMLEDLVEQQKGYHTHFDDLMSKYDKLMDERKKIMGVFAQQTSLQAEKEKLVVKSFKQWLTDREKNLDAHKSTLEEEKKVDDVMDFVGRTVATTEVNDESQDETGATAATANDPLLVARDDSAEEAIIDLSNVESGSP